MIFLHSLMHLILSRILLCSLCKDQSLFDFFLSWHNNKLINLIFLRCYHNWNANNHFWFFPSHWCIETTPILGIFKDVFIWKNICNFKSDFYIPVMLAEKLNLELLLRSCCCWIWCKKTSHQVTYTYSCCWWCHQVTYLVMLVVQKATSFILIHCYCVVNQDFQSKT